MLVAGSFVSRDLARAAKPLLETPGVTRLPYLSEEEGFLAGGGDPVMNSCVNLKYPAAGETSGIAIRLMGLGKLRDPYGFCRRARAFPKTPVCAFRLAAESDSLRHHMILLASLRQAATTVGENRRGAHPGAPSGRNPSALIIAADGCAKQPANKNRRGPKGRPRRKAKGESLEKPIDA